MTKSVGTGNWFDLKNLGLILNARKEKGAKMGLASAFASVDNFWVVESFLKSNSEFEDVQQPIFMDAGA